MLAHYRLVLCCAVLAVVVVPFGTHLDTVDDYCDFVFVSLSRAAAPAAVEFEFCSFECLLTVVHRRAYYRCTRREFGSTQQTQQQQQLFRL